MNDENHHDCTVSKELDDMLSCNPGPESEIAALERVLAMVVATIATGPSLTFTDSVMHRIAASTNDDASPTMRMNSVMDGAIVRGRRSNVVIAPRP